MGGEGNHGQIDAVDLCGLFTSRTFLGINQSDEVSELSIKVTKFRQLKRSNEVTKVTTTPYNPRFVLRHTESHPPLKKLDYCYSMRGTRIILSVYERLGYRV
jgi:hypothetical protein